MCSNRFFRMLLMCVFLIPTLGKADALTNDAEQQYFKRMYQKYIVEIERMDYHRWVDDGEIPGPVAAACEPTYNGLYKLVMDCRLPIIRPGQYQAQRLFVSCISDMDCRAENNVLLGYWKDPYDNKDRGGVTFLVPPGYYVWYGVIYRSGYGPFYQEGFVDVVNTVNVAEEQHAVKDKATTYSAWCDPQQDDACYIDEKKISRKDLPKYIPSKDCDNTAGLMGVPGDPFCYDEDGNVRAVSSQFFQ